MAQWRLMRGECGTFERNDFSLSISYKKMIQLELPVWHIWRCDLEPIKAMGAAQRRK